MIMCLDAESNSELVEEFSGGQGLSGYVTDIRFVQY